MANAADPNKDSISPVTPRRNVIRRYVLKQLMLGLIYPAVLGTVMYTGLEVSVEPLVARLAGRAAAHPFDADVAFKLSLLVITLVFYGCDFLYLTFTKNFDRLFFCFDLIFIAVLYLTVYAIDVAGDRQRAPNLRIVLWCYVAFLILYLIWDFLEKRCCANESERGFYKKMMLWESLSILFLVTVILGLHCIADQANKVLTVGILLFLITSRFAWLTWKKREFCFDKEGKPLL